MKTTVIRLLLAFVLALAFGASMAQSYPTKPIRFIVGFAPGGANDTLARLVGQRLTERLGQPVIVENKPGADSIIGTDYVAKAPPDGYTLLVSSVAMVLNPSLYDRVPYDAGRDFIPITLFASDPVVFAVHPSIPAASIKELISLAKSKPGQLFYSSGAPAFHVSAELFKRQAGINIVHVPYKGSGPAIAAAISAEVPMVAVEIPSALAQLRAGKLRALAITGPRRSEVAPNIPTMAESGMANFEQVLWIGLFAPAATPRTIIDRLYGELSVVLKTESMKERLAAMGYETNDTGMTPAAFGAFFYTDLANWSKGIGTLALKRAQFKDSTAGSK
ncbi:MAG: tripartite tricarboxylate transporter substrate binding protein [Betaproteobacteria bacterium]|nr:tripartite tricarboxylate transporter substrate binding protein [Betaproteobacteria bacterium]